MRLRIINEELSEKKILDTLGAVYDQPKPEVKEPEKPSEEPPIPPEEPKVEIEQPSEHPELIKVNSLQQMIKEVQSKIKEKIDTLENSIEKTKNEKLKKELSDLIKKLNNKNNFLKNYVHDINDIYKKHENAYIDMVNANITRTEYKEVKEKFDIEMDKKERLIININDYVDNFDEVEHKSKSKSTEGLTKLKEIFNKNFEKLSVEEQEEFKNEYLEVEQELKRINSKIDLTNDNIQIKEVDGLLPEEDSGLYSQRIELMGDITKILKDFKSKWKTEPEKLSAHESVDKTDFRGPKWYKRKYEEYVVEILNIPNALVHTKDTLRRLSDSSSYSNYISNADKQGDLMNKGFGDKNLIFMVANGVRPLAHVSSEAREVYFGWTDRETQQNLAYIPAPKRMGGGTIWYKPHTQIGYRPYGPKLKGRDKIKKRDKDDSFRTFDPLRPDPNRNIAELYLWNNIANKASPRLFNFINGLCLGYHRDFVIWYCESEYGLKDTRQPDRSFLKRLFDRADYALRNYKDEYGRPGTLNSRGPFAFVKRYPLYFNKVLPFLGDDKGFKDSFRDVADSYYESGINKPGDLDFDDLDKDFVEYDELLAADIDKTKYKYISESSFFNSLQNHFKNL